MSNGDKVSKKHKNCDILIKRMCRNAEGDDRQSPGQMLYESVYKKLRAHQARVSPEPFIDTSTGMILTSLIRSTIIANSAGKYNEDNVGEMFRDLADLDEREWLPYMLQVGHDVLGETFDEGLKRKVGFYISEKV